MLVGVTSKITASRVNGSLSLLYSHIDRKLLCIFLKVIFSSGGKKCAYKNSSRHQFRLLLREVRALALIIHPVFSRLSKPPHRFAAACGRVLFFFLAQSEILRTVSQSSRPRDGWLSWFNLARYNSVECLAIKENNKKKKRCQKIGSFRLITRVSKCVRLRLFFLTTVLSTAVPTVNAVILLLLIYLLRKGKVFSFLRKGVIVHRDEGSRRVCRIKSCRQVGQRGWSVLFSTRAHHHHTHTHTKIKWIHSTRTKKCGSSWHFHLDAEMQLLLF